MLWIVAKKTILNSLYDLRFTVASALIILLMGLSAVFFSLEGRARAEASWRLENEARRRNNLEEVYVVRQPAPLMFIAEGGEQYLPNVLKITPWMVDHSFVVVAVKSLVPKFENLDWVYIVGIFMSLLALFFSFDAVSGEKEAGRLSLTLSYPVKRFEILLGTCLGTVSSFLPTMLLGVLVNLVIISLFHGQIFNAETGVRIALALVLSLVYVSLFSLIGVLASCFVHKSSVALISGLLVWVLFIVVIPSGAGVLARTVTVIPSDKDVQNEIFRLRLEYGKGEVNSQMVAEVLQRTGHRRQAEQQVQELEEVLEEKYSEQQEKLQKLTSAVLEDFARQRDAQTEIARLIARLSPLAIYQYALEELVGSGYARYQAFLEAANHYMQRYSEHAGTLRRQYRDQAIPMSFGAVSHGGLVLVVTHSRSYANVPIDPATFPRFEAKGRSLAQSANRALFDILGLILLNAACFLISLFKFEHYDVR